MSISDGIENATGVSIPQIGASGQQTLGGGFDRIEWDEQGNASIYFDQDNGMDGFYVIHRSEPDVHDDPLWACEAPKFTGPVTLPLIKLIRESEYRYPDRVFKLVGAEGTFSSCEFGGPVTVPTEILETAYFKIPERFDVIG